MAQPSLSKSTTMSSPGSMMTTSRQSDISSTIIIKLPLTRLFRQRASWGEQLLGNYQSKGSTINNDCKQPSHNNKQRRNDSEGPTLVSCILLR
jgi:hypothetical protein